jgi:hypothetical protein
MDFYTGRAYGLSRKRSYLTANHRRNTPGYSFTYVGDDEWPLLYKFVDGKWQGYIPQTQQTIHADTLIALKFIAYTTLKNIYD